MKHDYELKPSESRYRVGVDVGGTFTDIVVVSNKGSLIRIDKILTTPDRPDDAVVDGVKRVLEAEGIPGSQIAYVVHGTTLFTNALIERKGARTALVTTQGFRDAIEIAREHRYDMYDLRMRRPEPLAPRRRRFEIRERMLADGTIRTPLDERALEELVKRLQASGVEAVGVCLLHAYANPAHERRVGAVLRAALPGVAVSLSSEVAPEIREYERSVTTLANAYLQPVAGQYLARLRRRLRDECGIAGALHIMQSNGGVADIQYAEKFPVRAVESGPAAGALAARRYGALLGRKTLISFDMGGTTAKACVISGGSPPVAEEFEVARVSRFRKGSGLPIRVPAIELLEVGTGGGSIARVDALGRLAAGPESAGADPGPASYGLGGNLPTVTDSDLALGYLDPNFFLGGAMKLDSCAAHAAIEERIAGPLGLGVPEAAWSVHQVANESMAAAARVHAVERGKDITKATLFAFGGAGPVHAFGIARILGCREVVYPAAAGVISAIGLLVVPLALDLARSLPGLLEDLDWGAVDTLFRELEAEAREGLARSVPASAIKVDRHADLRYQGQGFEVRAPVPGGALDLARAGEVRTAFEQAYAERYGHRMDGAPVEAVTWRVVARGPEPPFSFAQSAPQGGAIQKGSRQAWVPLSGRFGEVPVYDRYRLATGCRLAGPAIIEERESTVVVNGDADIRVESDGSLSVMLQEAGP